MLRKISSLLKDLSTADLKRLLAARERIDVLEEEQSRLMKDLAKVEKELGSLMSNASRAGAGAGKKVSRKASGAEKMKLEDVIVSVIRKNRSPVAFQDLKARILKCKLFKTKSGNFDNVLRRTLSTSKMVKRVGRGIYDVT